MSFSNVLLTEHLLRITFPYEVVAQSIQTPVAGINAQIMQPSCDEVASYWHLLITPI